MDKELKKRYWKEIKKEEYGVKEEIRIGKWDKNVKYISLKRT